MSRRSPSTPRRRRNSTRSPRKSARKSPRKSNRSLYVPRRNSIGSIDFSNVVVPVETIEQRQQRLQRDFLDSLDRQFDRRRLSPRLSPIARNNPQQQLRTPPGQNQARYWNNNMYYDPVDGWVEYPSPPTPPRPVSRKRVRSLAYRPLAYNLSPRRDGASRSRMFSEDGDVLNTSIGDDRVSPLRMRDIRGYSPRRARRLANFTARRNLAAAFNRAALSDTSSVNSEDIDALYGDSPVRPRPPPNSPAVRKQIITAGDLEQAIADARRNQALGNYQPLTDVYDSDNDSLYQ